MQSHAQKEMKFPLQAKLAVPELRNWVIARTYASVHLLAMLAVHALRHPGTPPQLRPPPVSRDVLTQLGLWEPSVKTGMLPVAAVLLLVRAVLLVCSLSDM